MGKLAGKQRLHAIDNSSILPILSILAEEPNNSFGVTNYLAEMGIKKDHSAINRQMTLLRNDDKYLIDSNEKRNAFTINYEQILNDFYDYLAEIIEEEKDDLDLIQTFSHKYDNIPEEHILEQKYINYKTFTSKSFKKNFIKNYYLKGILKEYLIREFEIIVYHKKSRNIKGIFFEIMNYLSTATNEIHHSRYQKFSRQLIKDHDFVNLQELNYILLTFLHTTGNFEDGLVNAIMERYG